MLLKVRPTLPNPHPTSVGAHLMAVGAHPTSVGAHPTSAEVHPVAVGAHVALAEGGRGRALRHAGSSATIAGGAPAR